MVVLVPLARTVPWASRCFMEGPIPDPRSLQLVVNPRVCTVAVVPLAFKIPCSTAEHSMGLRAVLLVVSPQVCTVVLVRLARKIIPLASRRSIAEPRVLVRFIQRRDQETLSYRVHRFQMTFPRSRTRPSRPLRSQRYSTQVVLLSLPKSTKHSRWTRPRRPAAWKMLSRNSSNKTKRAQRRKARTKTGMKNHSCAEACIFSDAFRSVIIIMSPVTAGTTGSTHIGIYTIQAKAIGIGILSGRWTSYPRTACALTGSGERPEPPMHFWTALDRG